MAEPITTQPTQPTSWPIDIDDVRQARERISSFLEPTPLREYAPLNEEIGHDIRVLVKHENHNPTNAFKVRNGLSAVAALTEKERARGVIAASRGNHGYGLAYAGHHLGVPITICVPQENNPEKNAAMRGLGVELIEQGNDYDDAVVVAESLARERGMTLIHSTNNRFVLAGAGTITLEILEQEPELDAMVVAVGGGSQAVGALTVLRALRPAARVYAVQAAAAPAICESWHARKEVTTPTAHTFADGIATRMPFSMTFGALCEGLEDFVTVSEAEIAAALRLVLRTTHNLTEGAGATGVAGLITLRERLQGKRVAVILSGANIDAVTLRRVLTEEL